MARRMDNRRDWSLLPFVIVTGLLIGGALGFAIKVLGPTLESMASNPTRAPKLPP
ncbi:hypothetical protein [Microvirga sp. M2]|uniref:hypothetical protein n=1 Tax=Microvirga sp. M2 TaxID=3073270 RepID=UPI0039C26F5D